MTYVFILGGFGNIVFQLHSINAKKNIRVIKFLNSWIIKKLFGHTDHGIEYEKLLCYERATIIESIFLTILLLVDIIVCKIFSISFLTTFDLRRIKSTALLYEFIKVGYFQDNVDISKIQNSRFLNNVAIPKTDLNHDTAVLHFRAGDFIYQNLTIDKNYLRSAIIDLPDYIKEILVVTTDQAYFKKEFKKYVKLPLRYSSKGFEEDFSTLASAHVLIGSSSTFGLIAAMVLERPTLFIVPKDFIKKFTFSDINSFLVKK